jgi:ADP-ribosylation factor-like protein 6
MGFFKMIATALGFKSREARIIVIGLDNSGKTTLIQHLKPKKVGKTVTIFHPKIMMALYSLRQAKTSEVTPTVGFTIEEFSKNNISFTVYDMSGQGRYRSLWEYYRPSSDVFSLSINCSIDSESACVWQKKSWRYC